MSPALRFLIAALMITAAAAFVLNPRSGFAASASQIDRDVDAALVSLYGQTPKAKELGGIAKGILVFPKILKAGLIIGTQGGEAVSQTPSETV